LTRLQERAAVLLRHDRQLVGAGAVGERGDLLLVGPDQRAQHRQVGDPVDRAQVRKRLRGNLVERFAGDQRQAAPAPGDPLGDPQHHPPVEDHA